MAELEQSQDDIAADLDRLRGEIDAIDRRILKRLNERARLVKQVGELHPVFEQIRRIESKHVAHALRGEVDRPAGRVAPAEQRDGAG